MIELSPNTALMLYLGITLLCLLGVWTFQRYPQRKNFTLSSEKKLCVCEFCHFAYLADGEKKITRCPQCQSYNKPL